MSTSKVIEYKRGAELPSLTLPWDEETAQNVWGPLDLSAGYTFAMTFKDSAGSTVLTKTTNIVGQVGSVLVNWIDGDLDQTPGTYTADLRATTTGSLDRDYRTLWFRIT